MYSRILLLALLCLSVVLNAQATAPDHIVISEVQIEGVTSKDEFIELLNPTASPISMVGWELKRWTKSGTEYPLLPTTGFADVTLGPHSCFLIAHPDYQGNVTPNKTYASSNNIAADNTVFLRNDADVVVDMVGMGEATIFESAATVNPDTGKSISRKDVLLGSGAQGPAQDTDDNSQDFVLQDTPNPQNSDIALPVTLMASQAYWSAGSMIVTWECLDEQVLHWHVWRADGVSPELVRVTAEPIRVSDDGQYKCVDDTIEPDQTYSYVLEAFDRIGTSSRVPVETSTTSVMHGNRLTTLWGRLKNR